MNDPALIGPCAGYEHDLVDLHDGGLPPERASDVRLHMQRCARCAEWAAGFAALDAGLAANIVAPALSPGFDARLRERLESLRAPADRADLRTRLEREHAALVTSLRSSARLRAALGAAGSVATTLGVLLASRQWLEQGIDLLPTLTDGSGQPLVLGATAAAISAAALAWSVARGGLPLPGMRR
jgi:anti-sigma factor RsiW